MKENWHKWLLIVISVLVAGISGMVTMGALSFSDQFILEPARPNDELPPTDEAVAGIARMFVESTQEWKTPVIGEPPKSVPLFVSIPIVESGGVLIDMSDPNARKLREPVSNAWLLENNLDFLNAGVLSQDPDGDGFTNLAEWNEKTDPTDASSHPPYAGKLVMHSRQQTDYILRFSARPDSERFQIMKVPSAKHPERGNFYLRIGETTGDGMFRVDGFEEKKARNKFGIEEDTSVVKGTYLPDGKTYELIRNRDTIIPTYYGELEFLLEPGERFYVKEGDTFNIVKDPETKYRLTKVNEDSAVITYQTGTEPEQTLEIKKK